jgi:hypothetical protein
MLESPGKLETYGPPRLQGMFEFPTLISLRQRIRVWMAPSLARKILAFKAAVVACSRVPGCYRGITTGGPDGCPQAGASSASRA